MKILTQDQVAALAGVLNLKVDELSPLVPDAGIGVFAQWNFVLCMHLAAYRAGVGLRIETECLENTTKHGLWKWCVQAFHSDGSPTGAADEIRASDKDGDLALMVALCLLDLAAKTGG